MFIQNCFIRIENDFSLLQKVSMMGYQPEMFINYEDLDLANENWQLYRKVTPQELIDLLYRSKSIYFLSNPAQIGKNK